MAAQLAAMREGGDSSAIAASDTTARSRPSAPTLLGYDRPAGSDAAGVSPLARGQGEATGGVTWLQFNGLQRTNVRGSQPAVGISSGHKQSASAVGVRSIVTASLLWCGNNPT